MSANYISRLQLSLVVVFAALSLAAPAALAQSASDKDKAKALFREAKTQYDLGDFDEAVRLFKQAYELSQKPSALYNIGQAYRQKGDCQALFFYKRYLNVAGPKARYRKEVESRIKELRSTCQAIEDLKEKPPPGAMSPDDKSEDDDATAETSTDESDDTGAPGGIEIADNSARPDDEYEEDDGDLTAGSDDAGVIRAAATSPARLATSVELGSAFLSIGDSGNEINIDGSYFSLSVGAAYPLQFGKVGVDIGALATYTTVPWKNDSMSGTAGMTGLFGNLGGRYWVIDRLALRGHVGAGAMLLSGLEAGSVFLNPGDRVDGTLTMFNIRFGVGLDYLLTRNLVLTASPFSYSYSPAKSGLRTGIDAFTRIEITAGLGYRL